MVYSRAAHLRDKPNNSGHFSEWWTKIHSEQFCPSALTQVSCEPNGNSYLCVEACKALNSKLYTALCSDESTRISEHIVVGKSPITLYISTTLAHYPATHTR